MVAPFRARIGQRGASMKSFLVAAVMLLPLAAGCAGFEGLEDVGSLWACQPENPTEITPVNVTLVYL